MRLLVLLASLTTSAAAHAAPPTVNYFYPAGGQRGQTVETTAAGSIANWPVQCWASRPGLTVTPAKDQGKLSIAIAPDAVPGVYWLRLYDAEGAANPQPFIVGTLNEVVEQEPNDSPEQPQMLSGAAATVNGKLQKRGDVDVFAVGLTQGQTLVAALEAHRTLDSPVDAVLQIVSPQGAVLAQNDDERELDPLLTFVAPASGNYLVRVFGFPSNPDTSIALSGAETYAYRLTITAGGFLDAALPLAASDKTPTTVELLGWNLPDSARKKQLQPAAGQTMVDVFDPALAESLSLPVEPHLSLVEVEPNPPEQPQLIQLPATISGRISERRDRDAYRFSAKKGDVFEFQLESRTLGYPLDAVLEAFKAEGGSPIVRADDAGKDADPLLKFTVPADGEYRIVVSDLYHHFGPRFVYRLRAAAAQPDFRLTVDAPSFTVAAGKPLEIPLKIERLQNFAGEITFSVEGLPPGSSLASAKSEPKGDSAKAVKLVIAAGGEAFAGPIRIRSEAAGDKSAIKHQAQAALPGHTATTSDLWLTITAAK